MEMNNQQSRESEQGRGGRSPKDKEVSRRFHDTKFLLKQYRHVKFAVEIAEEEMNQRMESEHGMMLSSLENNAELAGVDLSGTKLEKYAQSVIQSKNMLMIISNALNAVRAEPEDGELLYDILYLTYFTPRKPQNRDEVLMKLERIGYPMCMVTYHTYLNMAIRMMDRILWGYTTRDCMEIVERFLNEKQRPNDN